ncbi:MAG: hypothetical protein IPM32_02265 [Ignavibacteriae bacterium]|nr:hypothetical protein [Ignavibacteriota bacterium]
MKSFTRNMVMYFLLITGILTLLSCCNQKEIKLTSQKTKTNDSLSYMRIEQITIELNKAVIENDYETQLKYFTNNAVIAPPLGPKLEGKKAIKKAYEKNIDDNVVIHSFNAKIEDMWSCDDRIYEKGTWAMSQSTKWSKIPKAYHGSYFEIWQVENDTTILIDYMIYTLSFNPFLDN